MPSKGQKVILGILVVVFLSVGALSYSLTQPKWLASAALYLLSRHPGAVVYKEVKIQTIEWKSLNHVILNHVQVKVRAQGQEYNISIPQLDVDQLSGIFGRDSMKVLIKRLAIASDAISTFGVQIDSQVYFKNLHYDHMELNFVSPFVEWNRYKIENLQGSLTDNTKRLKFTSVKGQLYTGTIQLNGWLRYAQHVSYKFDVQLASVDTLQIAQINPSFAQLSAVVSGTMELSDLRSKGLSIEANLNAPLGGSMKAALLQYLAQYIPQRQQIEDLIKQNATIPLDKIQFQITTLSRDKMSSNVLLNSSSLNLNMNVKFDINVEGGIDQLIKHRF